MIAVGRYSPDGKTVLTGHTDGTVQLWDAATHQPLGEPLLHEGRLLDLAFSSKGQTIATLCSDTVRLWRKDEVAIRQGGKAAALAPFTVPVGALRQNGPIPRLAFSRDLSWFSVVVHELLGVDQRPE
jgi:WD40 repeat protein